MSARNNEKKSIREIAQQGTKNRLAIASAIEPAVAILRVSTDYVLASPQIAWEIMGRTANAGLDVAEFAANLTVSAARGTFELGKRGVALGLVPVAMAQDLARVVTYELPAAIADWRADRAEEQAVLAVNQVQAVAREHQIRLKQLEQDRVNKERSLNLRKDNLVKMRDNLLHTADKRRKNAEGKMNAANKAIKRLTTK
jgi:hypothetical protein